MTPKNPFQSTGIAGGGSWGTALAVLASRNGIPVKLYCRNPELARSMETDRVNEPYLPDIQLPENIHPTSNLEDLLDCDLVLVVPPSKAFRELAAKLGALGASPETVWVSCTKGIENDTGMTMTEILAEEIRTDKVAVLSGPNLAVEVARGVPAAAVVGCGSHELCAPLQSFFSFSSFRAYTSPDVRGIQLGGALKNIYAIGAGCSDGFGMGDNAKAALVTRSLAEMMRLGEAMGGRRETFHGLSGIGDLMVTCFSRHSRNRTFGERVGKGETPEEIAASTRMVAEGVPAAKSAWRIAKDLEVETPVIDALHAVLHENADPRAVMKSLLDRSPKPEHS